MADYSTMFSEYKKHLDALLWRVTNKELRDFTIEALTEKAAPKTKKELRKYSRNIDLVRFALMYLKKRELYSEIQGNKQIDTFIVALLLHNIYFDGDPEKWIEVFYARKNFKPLEDKYRTAANYDAFNFIWQLIECQLWSDMPVIACGPVRGQITETFCQILWFFNHQFKSYAKELDEADKWYEENVLPYIQKEASIEKG